MKLRKPTSWWQFISNPANEPAIVQYTTGDGDYFKGAKVQAWDRCRNFIAVWNPAGRPAWVRRSRLLVINKGTVL